ncbi:MAG: hypothetical protein BYD32DRAFT_55125 [Podila humilis]|nr:MAG: hypothetical protein BYD32DRAFT_55125 [Podila humilis]
MVSSLGTLDSNDPGHDEQPQYDNRSGGAMIGNTNNSISNTNNNAFATSRPSNTDSGFQDTTRQEGNLPTTPLASPHVLVLRSVWGGCCLSKPPSASIPSHPSPLFLFQPCVLLRSFLFISVLLHLSVFLLGISRSSVLCRPSFLPRLPPSSPFLPLFLPFSCRSFTTRIHTAPAFTRTHARITTPTAPSTASFNPTDHTHLTHSHRTHRAHAHTIKRFKPRNSQPLITTRISTIPLT